MPANTVRPYILLVLILILAFTTFYPSLHNSFTNWDDPIYVTENTVIRDMSLSGLRDMFTTYISGNYQPLTLLSYALEYSVFKERPFGYHLVSLSLHLVNCVLVFWFIRLLTRNHFIALFTCLLFAVHPTKVESVAWIADQKDLLSSMLLLAMLVAYQYYLMKKRTAVLYLSLLLFLLSFPAKANGLAYPFILLLVDYYSKNKVTCRDWIQKIPFFAASFLFGIVAVLARQSYQENLLEGLFSAGQTVLLGFHRFVFYFLLRNIAPVSHSWLYPHPHQLFPSKILVAAAIAVTILVFTCVFLWKKKVPIVFFGWMFFSVSLFPVLTVVIIGHSADRFTYLPSIGLYVIAAYAVFVFYEKVRSQSLLQKGVGTAVCLAVLVTMAMLSRQSCFHWKDGAAVWSQAISQHDNFGLAYFNRADSYSHQGKLEQALSDYNRAAQLDPDYYEIYLQRGLVYQRMRQYDRAIIDFSAAIRFKPDCYEAFNFRGVAYAFSGSINKALADYAQAIALQPGRAEAYHNRGFLYYSRGQLARACNDLNRACALGTCNYLGLLRNRGVCRDRN